MLALSVRQPFAWAIVNGWKDIENRSEPPARRRAAIGKRIYIHAGKTLTRADYEDISGYMAGLGVECPPKEDLPLGGIVGSVRVVDIVTKSRSRWFNGDHGMVLADPEVLRFVPYRGQLNLFRVDLRE